MRLQYLALTNSGHNSRPQATLPRNPVAKMDNAHSSWPVKRSWGLSFKQARPPPLQGMCATH